MAANMFENIECKDCPMDHGKRCPKPECKHCLEHSMAKSTDLVALPYTYVDVFPGASKMRSPDELVRLQEPHLLRSITSNGQVITRVQTAMVNHQAATPLQGTTFTAEIEGVEYTGKIAGSVISRDNTRNETARTIATTRSSSSADDNNNSTKSKALWINVDCATQIIDNVDVALTTDEHPEPIRYTIAVPRNGEPISAAIEDRKLRSFAERQLRLKGYNPATHSAYTAGHVRIIVDNTSNKLKDVEVDMVDPAPLPQRVQEFVCDPLDIDAVTGLTSALEEHMAETKSERVAEVFSTVNAHRKALESHLSKNTAETYKVSPTVNAAINEATNIMWDQVGTKIRVMRYYNRMRKESVSGRGMEWLKNKVEELVNDYNELMEMESESKLVKKAYYRVKREAKKADGRDMVKAINRRLQETAQLNPLIIADLQTQRDKLVPIFGQ